MQLLPVQLSEKLCVRVLTALTTVRALLTTTVTVETALAASVVTLATAMTSTVATVVKTALTSVAVTVAATAWWIKVYMTFNQCRVGRFLANT